MRCQVHSSHILTNHKALNYNNSKIILEYSPFQSQISICGLLPDVGGNERTVGIQCPVHNPSLFPIAHSQRHAARGQLKQIGLRCTFSLYRPRPFRPIRARIKVSLLDCRMCNYFVQPQWLIQVYSSLKKKSLQTTLTQAKRS